MIIYLYISSYIKAKSQVVTKFLGITKLSSRDRMLYFIVRKIMTCAENSYGNAVYSSRQIFLEPIIKLIHQWEQSQSLICCTNYIRGEWIKINRRFQLITSNVYRQCRHDLQVIVIVVCVTFLMFTNLYEAWRKLSMHR